MTRWYNHTAPTWLNLLDEVKGYYPPGTPEPEDPVMFSIAMSLKRIADALFTEGDTDATGDFPDHGLLVSVEDMVRLMRYGLSPVAQAELLAQEAAEARERRTPPG